MENFDIVSYCEAIETFISKMDEVSEMYQVERALDKMCKFFKVGEIDYKYKKPGDHELKSAIIYSRGVLNENNRYTFFKKDGKRVLSECTFVGSLNAPIWDEEADHKLDIFAKALNSYHDKIVSTYETEKFEYKDEELQIYNLKYLKKTLTRFIEEGVIGEYTACAFNFQGFSLISQKIGRDNGTEVMRIFVEILKNKLSEGGYVFRLGITDFAVLFKNQDLELVMEQLKGIRIVYNNLTNESVWLTSRAGYYEIPADCEKGSTILNAINSAVYMAESVMKTSYAFFDEELIKVQQDVKKVEDLFLDAIAGEEFQVYYQPKVSLKEYRLAGAEALCRWFHDGQMFPPYKFIPVLEQSKSICTLDFYMLDHVCKDLRRWMDEGKKVVKTSVNLSRRNMDNPNLLQDIIDTIDRNNVPHEYLEIELTETTTDVDFKELKNLVLGLRENGISTSVDDFGVGYSSLNLIRDLPWNTLKIDRSFLPVGTGNADYHQTVMFKHIVSMALDMGLECIVEGVETLEHIKLLKENKCYLAQGYYFDRPLPKTEFETRLELISA